MNVTSGVAIASFAVNVRLTTSLTIARVFVALLDAMDVLVSVGVEFSNVTVLESLTLVTFVPVIPERLVKAIVKVTGPDVSLVSAV